MPPANSNQAKGRFTPTRIIRTNCRGVYGLRLRSSIFCCRTCVYSKIFRDIPLVWPNAISKNLNNVVISSPRVLIFSRTLVPSDSFLLIWSRDLELPVRPPGGAKLYFSNSIFSATVSVISEIFSGSCAPQRSLLKFRGTWG